MMRNATIDVQCPSCDTTLRVAMSPDYPGTRSTPPEPPEILDVEDITHDGEPGCLHYWDDDDRLYEVALEALTEQDQAAYDREMDSRIDRDFRAQEQRWGVGEEEPDGA